MAYVDITSVWSAYGHRFMSDGEGDYESCLTCGAMYQLINDDPEDPSHGAYTTASGDEPQQCTHNTSMVHGYSGEAYCHACNSTDCEHTKHDCPCIACDS